MASAEFLEQALSSDVDENDVNAIVGTLENHLVTSAPIVSSEINLFNDIPYQISSTTSENTINGQKYNTDRSNAEGGENHHSSFVTLTNFSQNNVINEASFKVNEQPESLHDNGIKLESESPMTENKVAKSEFKNITMQPPMVLKQGSATGQVGMQPSMVPMTANSSMAGSIPNVMTINKAGGQNVVVTTQNMGSTQPAILPNVQILNMRPGAPAVAAQKSVATVSPRVVIGTPQVVGNRATSPGITLQTLQSLQQGQQGHLLLKTENGQYQLLRVGPAPANNLTAAQQTLRLSTVPAHPGVATVSTSVGSPSQIPGQMPPAPTATPVPASSVLTLPTSSHPLVATQKPLDNTKEKCRNFFANLLDLSSKQPQAVETSVRSFIQELIDAQVEPEEFCDRLERLLDASPQPCLIGFLKKSLPLLRQSLVTKELVIEGINPPSAHVAFSLPGQSSQVQMLEDEGSSSPTLASLLPSIMPMFSRPPSPKPVALTSQNYAQFEDDGSSSPVLATLLPPVMPLTLSPRKAVSPPSPPKPVTMNTQNVQQKPPPKPGSTIAVLQNIPVHTKVNVTKVGKSTPANSKNFSRPGSSSAALSTVLTAGKSLLKDKDKKGGPQFSSQPFTEDKMAGDDDINDVAAMGGVNLAEETQRILGSTDMIGTQIRSCKDEYLIPMSLMQSRVRAMVAKHGLEEPSPEVANMINHAVNERLKSLVEKLAVTAQHRIDMLVKTDNRYEVTQDVKGQLKFLEELDKVDKKRREDSEREMLLRAAKSRSKNEDPEQAKLKAKAKEMQRAELEELRQREANLTALQAIGPRKKPRMDGAGGSGDAIPGSSNTGPGSSGGRSQLALRTRLKRINQRDMIHLLEQESENNHSTMLFRNYMK